LNDVQGAFRRHVGASAKEPRFLIRSDTLEVAIKINCRIEIQTGVHHDKNFFDHSAGHGHSVEFSQRDAEQR
jgi:hypothetical protein